VYLQGIRVQFEYERHRFKVKETAAKNRKFLFPPCKTSTANNSGSIKDRTTRFGCVMGFWLWRIKWYVWPPYLSCDRNFMHFCISCMHFTGTTMLQNTSFFTHPESQVRIWRSSGQGQVHRTKKGRKCVGLFPQCRPSLKLPQAIIPNLIL